MGFAKMRDHVLTVTNGEVTSASRVEQGSNIRWEIIVGPTGNSDVTVTLSATTDCDDQGSVCTSSGKKLSGQVSLTVPGPQQQDSGQQESNQNNAPTGAPTISGTAREGQTLTAGTSGIADADGLGNVSFSYQWIRNDGNADTDIQDATATSYTLTSDDVGKTIKVRVTFTDHESNNESLTSAATGTVAAKPLTASVQSAPASHDGSTTFTFELHFSENIKMGFKTMRDRVLDVTGGTITKARRLTQGSNAGWEITVTPSGNADVIITLSATTDCSAQGAVCTQGGKKLSEGLQLTVSGPGG